MADIPIWPGSSSFGLISNPTPFAFYDDELSSWKEQNETFRFRVEDYEY